MANKVCCYCGILILLSFSSIFSLHAKNASVKALGMGSTGVAFPQDAIASAYNPAGINDLDDRLDIGAIYAYTIGKGKISLNFFPEVDDVYNGTKTKEILLAEIGLTKTLPYHLSAGLAIYNQDYVKTTYTKPLPIFGTSKAGLEYIHEVIAPALSWQFHPCHSIGLCANIHIQRFKVKGLENLDRSLVAAFPGYVTNRGYEYSSGVGLKLGWLGQLSSSLTLGATYQPKTTMRRFHKYKSFFPDKGIADIPSAYSLGVAWRPLDCLALTCDVEWVQWRDVRAYRNGAAENPILNRLGTKNGSGFGFRNQILYCFGCQLDLNECWTLRAGFRHSRSIVKSSSTSVNLLTLETIEDYISLGATYWLGSQEISFFYAHGFENPIYGTKPLSLLVGSGFVDIKQERDAFGLSWGYRY